MKNTLNTYREVYSTKAKLTDIYLEFANDYLTYQKWSEHKGIRKDLSARLIHVLREIHEDSVKEIKELETL